jgi:hypothetical protein
LLSLGWKAVPVTGVDVALRFADSLDQIEPDDYYRFLDCGFEIPLSNGSDHPARVAGCARVYVKTEAPFIYRCHSRQPHLHHQRPAAVPRSERPGHR